ncbi:MAG: response regulator with CheY-like receiver domain and winged-helix DNA-binding domain [Planctomycetota bacterium]|nr:response regulator with CheY-like receiver domain and winged-helix DNA-binding domain [Planctomycetota bacterium]
MQILDRSAGIRPAMPESTSEPSMKPSVYRPRRRLLLVDDNAEGRRALARLLEFYDFDVTSVPDGASALQILRQSPPPEFILTDLLLPDIDGREIARQAQKLVPKPIIVMITGWDFGSEIPDRAESGIDHVFLKPLDMADLVSTLTKAGARKI